MKIGRLCGRLLGICLLKMRGTLDIGQASASTADRCLTLLGVLGAMTATRDTSDIWDDDDVAEARSA
jgi:hypothetical protein